MSTLASVLGPPRVDRRVRKTRRALGEALLELCTLKRYESITVQDVIDRADVSRSTFYAHYVDKDNLLVDAFRDLRLRSRRGAPSSPSDEAFGWSLGLYRWAVGLVDEFDCGPEALCSVMANPACALALEEFEREIEALAMADLARLSGRSRDRVPPVVVSFVVGAFMRLFTSWLDTPDRSSPEEIDQQFRVLVLPGAAAALEVEPSVLRGPVSTVGRTQVAGRGA